MKQYYCPKCKGYIIESEVQHLGKAKFHMLEEERHQVMGQEEDAERVARESAGN